METLKTQDVWVLKQDVDWNDPITFALPMTALEKKSDMVVMAKDDFIKIVGDAFDAGQVHEYEKHFGAVPPLTENKTEYINQLIK